MKILDLVEQEDGSTILEMDLTDEEALTCYEVGIYLVPSETDKKKVIEEALLYMIMIGMIEEYNENDTWINGRNRGIAGSFRS